MSNSDFYPLSLLAGFKLMPTGSGKGVMAICHRHASEVSALVVNSLIEAPTLADLAFMAGEHEAECHDGPPMPDPDEQETGSTGPSSFQARIDRDHAHLGGHDDPNPTGSGF